jgi:hypothetical protein
MAAFSDDPAVKALREKIAPQVAFAEARGGPIEYMAIADQVLDDLEEDIFCPHCGALIHRIVRTHFPMIFAAARICLREIIRLILRRKKNTAPPTPGATKRAGAQTVLPGFELVQENYPRKHQHGKEFAYVRSEEIGEDDWEFNCDSQLNGGIGRIDHGVQLINYGVSVRGFKLRDHWQGALDEAYEQWTATLNKLRDGESGAGAVSK